MFEHIVSVVDKARWRAVGVWALGGVGLILFSGFALAACSEEPTAQASPAPAGRWHVAEPPAAPVDPEEMERLAALGYLGATETAVAVSGVTRKNEEALFVGGNFSFPAMSRWPI